MFLQACGVLWFLNILCVVYFGVLCICIDDYMHDLYILEVRLVQRLPWSLATDGLSDLNVLIL